MLRGFGADDTTLRTLVAAILRTVGGRGLTEGTQRPGIGMPG